MTTAGRRALGDAVARVARRLEEVYALELDWNPRDFVLPPETARRLAARGGPRSGLLVTESGDGIDLALYLAAPAHPAAIVEETSHLVCLAWHAAQDRPVSALLLELQAEIDRFALARLASRSDPLAHFERFRWAAWVRAHRLRERYETAHRVALRYCRGLARRYPRRADTPALLAELRRFYRASPSAKLRH